MNPFGLAFDHPEFPARVTLKLETLLSFAWAGAGHGLYSVVVCAGFIPPQHSEIDTGVNTFLVIVINAIGAWKSFSAAIARDYRLHYRHEPSTSQLFILELLRLGGFLFIRALLLKHAAKLFAPLLYLAREPPLLLSTLYHFLVLWGLWSILPEIAIISSRGITLPKFIARTVGAFFEVYQQYYRESMAAIVIQPRSPDCTDGPTEYRYSAILTPRTIRLVRLESRERKVSCRLETVKLDEAPQFWAVSYTWGAEVKPMSLKITDSLGQDVGYIPITKNCASAIEALIPMGVRYLWLDAVCINQSDKPEKQLQIPLMGEIYSQASLVAGHLYTDNIFPVGLLIHKMVQALANGKKFDMSYAASFLIFRALGELFRHPYFERAWIVQEMVLAKSLILIYGRDCIHLDHLEVIAHGQSKDLITVGDPVFPGTANEKQLGKAGELLRLVTSIASFRERAAATHRLRQSLGQKDGSQRLTIAQIVDGNMSLGAKDPRDQVYALLSLASDSTVPELQPNYSLAVSNKEIFTKISWHYLQDGSHLNLFLGAGRSPRTPPASDLERTPGLPSWAYDFAIGPNRDFRLGNWAADLERNRAARLTCRLLPDMEQLSVYGTIIDHVAFVAPLPLPPGKWCEDYKTAIGKANEHFVAVVDETRGFAQTHVPERYPGGIAREEAYWRTMLMDRLSGQTPAPPEAEAILDAVYEMARQLGKIMSRPKRRKAVRGMSDECVKKAIDSIMETVYWIWVPYTFVVLKSGYMGWAPHGVQAGDVFSLFDGCIVPFLLRPADAGDTFTLLGDGYVHGFLPGQQPGVEGSPKQWLTLI
jgi:hypothetical protein